MSGLYEQSVSDAVDELTSNPHLGPQSLARGIVVMTMYAVSEWLAGECGPEAAAALRAEIGAL